MFADSKCNPPDIMVCYRVQKDGSTNCPNLNSAANCKSNQLSNGLNNQQTINAMSLDPQAQADAIRQGRLGPSGLPLKQSKSRELRASIMYSGCDCEKKNGLQDDCLRSECRGSPQCLTKPNPTCGPSEFSNGKHLEMKRFRERSKKVLRDVQGIAKSSKDSNNENPYAQLYKQTGDSATTGNHADDCCCCCCCDDANYYCVEGVLLDQNQNQPSNKQGGAAKCPGTAECGPGICPVGECPGGVCGIGGNNQNQNKDDLLTGNKQIECKCEGKGRS